MLVSEERPGSSNFGCTPPLADQSAAAQFVAFEAAKIGSYRTRRPMADTHQQKQLAARIQAALPSVTPGVILRAYSGGQLVHDVDVGATSRYYDMASLTKIIFTQQAMMQAYDRGLWHLQTRVVEVLADFPNKDVEIRQLLTHSSGIEWWKPFYEAVDLALPWQAKRAWLYGELKKSSFLKTGKSVYSDLGFMLLGFVLEKMHGKSLLDIWTETKSSSYLGTTLAFHIDNRPAHGMELFAPTEDCPWRKKLLRGEVHDDNTWALGGISTHAGLFGSMEDLSGFGLNLRAQLRGTGRVRVSRQTAQLFAARAVPRDAGDWALGCMLPALEGASCGKYFSAASVGHTGFTGTSCWYDPQRDLLVLVLSNRVHYGRENRAFLQLRPQLHDWVVESL